MDSEFYVIEWIENHKKPRHNKAMNNFGGFDICIAYVQTVHSKKGNFIKQNSPIFLNATYYSEIIHYWFIFI